MNERFKLISDQRGQWTIKRNNETQKRATDDVEIAYTHAVPRTKCQVCSTRSWICIRISLKQRSLQLQANKHYNSFSRARPDTTQQHGSFIVAEKKNVKQLQRVLNDEKSTRKIKTAKKSISRQYTLWTIALATNRPLPAYATNGRNTALSRVIRNTPGTSRTEDCR